MNMALIMTAVKHGATVANHTEVVQLHKDENGKLYGARVKDNLTGKEWDVKAKVRHFVGEFDIQSKLLHRVSSMLPGPSRMPC